MGPTGSRRPPPQTEGEGEGLRGRAADGVPGAGGHHASAPSAGFLVLFAALTALVGMGVTQPIGDASRVLVALMRESKGIRIQTHVRTVLEYASKLDHDVSVVTAFTTGSVTRTTVFALHPQPASDHVRSAVVERVPPLANAPSVAVPSFLHV